MVLIAVITGLQELGGDHGPVTLIGRKCCLLKGPASDLVLPPWLLTWMSAAASQQDPHPLSLLLCPHSSPF